MFNVLFTRLQQGHRTAKYPKQPPVLPDRFRGLPAIDPTKCPAGCRACVEACPTGAVAVDSGKPRVDLGSCLFCTDCTQACPTQALQFSRDHRLAARSRADLLSDGAMIPAGALEERLRKLFGRSLKLRQVSAGGCNACEADINVLGTLAFDLGRFGIQVVASPRHADGLLVTGPVTENMKLALRKTYDALPPPKIVIAVGACAISGGPFVGHPEVHNGVGDLLPVDLFIPGCPPHPYTILDGLLLLIGRLERRAAAAAGAASEAPRGT
ncbi:MAG: NADH-quinone oxidoreductase subunit NuoB [Deltaproteobacteria bacterium]|nr:NADH-quinone oxidoreductase subunit NuoB [Deltaproteobacteria bacterium]